MSESNQRKSIEISTSRLEAFSDGVFAIAITLLILEIKVPTKSTLEHESLADYLIHQWPQFFAYIFSFVIIGIYWANHHYLFKLFRRTDHVFNLLNVLFLLTIAFLPYPTGIFGEFIAEREHLRMAVIFYSIGITFPSLSWLLMWSYASRNRRLTDERLTDDFISSLSRKFLLSNVFYIIAIIISLFYPIISLVLNVTLTLIYLLPPPTPQYKSSQSPREL
ncbi:MAG: DUF1211 domain-containing protein [Bacteroidetes bacterium]|nr:MAG: DUF1211 domain-containing protein [Bacteroidota bacterium]